MKLLHFLIFFCLVFLWQPKLKAQSVRPDVTHYQVYVVPDFENQQISGKVNIQFNLSKKADKVIFDTGNLSITNVAGENIQGFAQREEKVILDLLNPEIGTYQVQMEYEGKPTRGLIFSTQREELYTVYFTEEWMVCNAIPDDKATFQLAILIPNHLESVASGILIDTVSKADDKTLYTWQQDYATPAYTYGLAVGQFNKFQEMQSEVLLNYYSANYTPKELEKIFSTTADMLSFFEEKASVPLPQKVYSQILMGNHYQEMSGFAVLKKSYGKMTLKDSMETNLMAHELAHQWWGNRVTCKNWKHFWLNEGMATFMSAVYNEHCFGDKKYEQDIDAYFKVYTTIKAKGKDKSLVFSDWSNPSGDDRNLVYFKGAYVMHLLRQELGDALFWKGIRYYTQKYFGKSVVTKDFQVAMEEGTQRDLADFFEFWVYNK